MKYNAGCFLGSDICHWYCLLTGLLLYKVILLVPGVINLRARNPVALYE